VDRLLNDQSSHLSSSSNNPIQSGDLSDTGGVPSGMSISDAFDFHDSQKRRRGIQCTAAQKELEEYQRIPVANATETIPEFWNRVRYQLPRLFDLAKRVFSVPCSQTASEREFSLLRLMCTHLRGRLSPATVNRLITCSAFFNRRNVAFGKENEKHRTTNNVQADSARVLSLLSTNRKRILDQASQVVSAERLLDLNLDSVLEECRIPSFLEPEDIDHDILNATDMESFLEFDDGTLPDDEDFIPELDPEKRYSKRSKGLEDDSPHSNQQARRSPGVCSLTACIGSSTLMNGSWTSTAGAKPIPTDIFRDHLQFVEFLPDSLIDSDDGLQTLSNEFIFKLTAKGNKKYNGRRGFISEVGHLIQFG
jgi:hypothetical protein